MKQWDPQAKKKYIMYISFYAQNLSLTMYE